MNRQYLRSDWRLQSAAVTGTAGSALSRLGVDVASWFPTQVPCTVLLALVRSGVYPDPRFGLNTLRIPDSADEFNAAHDLAKHSHLPDRRNPWRDPWWYRTEFDLATLPLGGQVWLNLDCLNYRADVWLNGRQVADHTAVAGMFQRFRLNVTEVAVPGARNALAVLVHPVDHPGVPDTQLEVFGKVRGFHKEIMRDVTEVMTVGYDCFPTVPDRNLGLIQDVSVDITGPVDLRHPFVRTGLPLPALTPATLTVSAELVNLADATVHGTLRCEVRGPDGKAAGFVDRFVSLAAGETRTVVLRGEREDGLRLAEPRLWWPNGYGDQPLYNLALEFETDGAVSSRQQTVFGIRRIDRELHEKDGAHGFRLLVNGTRVFCRGGYVQPEMMFDWDATRITAEMRYLASANLNYIVFEDIPNPPDALLEACDRLGLMFWNCFYDCYWLQPTTEYPDDLALLESCTVDLVKRYRNHPSLVIYMCQNEGETREAVYRMWRQRVLELDDTRFLVPSGSFPDYRKEFPEWIRQDTPVGMNDYPPKAYSWQTPATYYRWVRELRNWMFMIESGSASVPPLESLVQFIPALRDLPPNSGDNPIYPLDSTWAHFGANTYFEWFDKAVRLLYGEPTDVRDYVAKAHLVCYDQHRAFFEAVHHRMWEITSGFGEWKISSAFPDVQWQLYDWFLRPMVSLFAIRKACAPLHVQLSPLDGMVTVINNRSAVARVDVRASVYDLAMQPLSARQASLEAPANAYRDVFALALPTSAAETPVFFVKLELRAAAGALLADNFYWLSPRLNDCESLFGGEWRKHPANKPVEVPRTRPVFPELGRLPETPVTVRAQRVAATGSTGETAVRVRVSNPGPGLAFFMRLQALDRPAGEEILPVFWDDNYLSLLPGESKAVEVRFTGDQDAARSLAVRVSGWNVPAVVVPVAGEG